MGGNATIANFADASRAASTAYEAARAELVQSSKTFSEAQESQNKADVALKGAQQEFRDAAATLRRHTRELENARAELDLFRDGALASFTALRERSQVPEPVLEP